MLLASLALCGCAGVAPPPAAPTAPTAPAPPAPRPAALAVERQWLQSWFKGTPVRIEQRSEAAFDIEVPLEFCFDTGASAVKPPLAAVLDKLAQSLQRKPQMRVERLAAPGDAKDAQLARQRGDAVRKHLAARGVAAQQLAAAPAATAAPAVQMRIGLAEP